MTRKSAFGLPNIAGIFFVTLRQQRTVRRQVLPFFSFVLEYSLKNLRF